MKLKLFVVVALTALYAQAADRNREFAAGHDLYAAAQFRRAAARFQVLCNNNNDAEACYWAGLSYDRLADVRMPFGCKIDAKAHEYLVKATELAPSRPEYRDALFDFLLDTADCSRTALLEAAGILSTVPESDRDYRDMSRRLKDEKRVNASAGARLGRLFLIIPRATYSVAALPGSALTHSPAAERRREVSGSDGL